MVGRQMSVYKTVYIYDITLSFTARARAETVSKFMIGELYTLFNFITNCDSM